MSFDEAIHRLDRARADLKAADADSRGWDDGLRHQFDQARMLPMRNAGIKLSTALRKASEQANQIERLLR